MKRLQVERLIQCGLPCIACQAMRRFRTTVHLLIAVVVLEFPITGHCDVSLHWFKEQLGWEAKGTNNVASKLVELPDQHDRVVRTLDFSPDGKHLAVISAGKKVNVWDWKNKRIVKSLPLERGVNDGLMTDPLRFSPNGRWLAACYDLGSADEVIRIWRTDTWEVEKDIVDHAPGGCTAIQFTPDGNHLIRILHRAVMVPGDNFVMYATGTWLLEWGMRTVPFYTNTLAISPDGRSVALGGDVVNPVKGAFKEPIAGFGNPPLPDMNLIAIFDMERRAIIRTIPVNGVTNMLSRLVWSPSGTYLANAGGLGLQVLNAQTGELVVNVPPPFGVAATALRYSPDGRYLIEGTGTEKKNGWGKIWDGLHRTLLQNIPEDVGGIAVSQDGRYLATGVVGQTIIWQLK